MKDKEYILDQFKEKQKIFNNFSQKLEILLKELLDENKINFQNITTRTKDFDSLKNKIESKSKYNNLEEITDIVGCRIITYFESDLERIVEIIKKEFEIDKENSIDKKEILEDDRFGYLSYHIICSINETRKVLSEYKIYQNIKFEIQIRTILQHAWAEIEHDIGYKSNIQVPKQFRRRFSRIAGLLEMVDDEFSKIKEEINNYSKNLETTKDNLLNADINANSLKLYIQRNHTLEEIDKKLIKELNTKYYLDNEDKFLNDRVNIILKNIQKTNIKQIKELNELLKNNKDEIYNFIIEWFNFKIKTKKSVKELGLIKNTFGLIYLVFMLLLKNKDDLKDFFTDETYEESIKKAYEIFEKKKSIWKI